MADGYARIHRPKILPEYMGKRVKNTVLNRFKDGTNLPNTIMIYGPLGCGKTSIARLVAMEYNCLEKVDGHACGKCPNCLDVQETLIEKGIELDNIREVDIASESGKKDIEIILDDAIMEPMYPYNYKVLILDECHMASTAAQNKLLKITEEPPKHLIFIFCTTDPEKMLPTLRSRCQVSIEITKPTTEDMVDKLLEISQKEGLQVSKEALTAIAKYNKNTPRTCLSLLEDIAIEYGGKITVANVGEKIGSVAYDLFMEFYRCSNKSLEDIMMFVKSIESKHTYSRFISELIRFTLDVTYIRSGIALDEFPNGFIKEVKEFFKVYDKSNMDMLFQILEYAQSIASTDENSAELAVITTALRIGKIKLMSGLSDRQSDKRKEDSRASKNYTENKQNEYLENVHTAPVNIDDVLMNSVFGKNISEVVGVALNIDENDGYEDEGESLSDDDVIKLFSN